MLTHLCGYRCPSVGHVQSLGAELDKAKDKGKLSQLDVLHMKNVKLGKDKFKTLRQIRSGNTKTGLWTSRKCEMPRPR